MFFDFHAFQFQENQNQRQRQPRVYGNRGDPRLSMRDQEFKRHFRLTKNSVTRLCDMLEEDLSKIGMDKYLSGTRGSFRNNN